MRRVLLVLLLGGGCAPPYQDFTTAQNQVYCEAVFGCCSADKAAALVPGATDSGSCQSVLNGRADAAYKDGFSHDAFTFDKDAADKCLAAWRAAYGSCDSIVDKSTLGDCTRAIVGKTAVGADCALDSDCVADAFCVPGLGSALGKCAAKAKAGEPCGGTPCVGGLACLPSNRCGNFLDGGQPCETDDQCKSGACVGPNGMPHSCNALEPARASLCGN